MESKSIDKSLEQQYIDAAKDQERNHEFKEWDQMNNDGLNPTDSLFYRSDLSC